MEEKYQKIKEIVEKELSCSAHDMEHTIRVYNLCLHLAKDKPNIDLDVLKTAALLHDIARVKEDQDKTGKTDHAILSAEMAEKILKDFDYSEEKIEKIKNCIISHRTRSAEAPESKEAEILSDADKLDIMGAVGLSRMFAYVGRYGQKIYRDVNLDKYIKENFVGGKINGRIRDVSEHAPNLEFETKVKHLLNKFYTQKAKELAKQRINFMQQFFERLKKEINGEL